MFFSFEEESCNFAVSKLTIKKRKKAGSELTSVAGKTGTASVGSIISGDNEIVEFHVSFCGYFPATAPKYSIIVSMSKYGLPASGGLMAGTVFHNIVEWMVNHRMLPQK